MTYLFDFDGTLVDSMPTYAAMMLKILDEYHVPHGNDVIKTVTPLGYVLTARYFKEKLGHPLSEEALVARMYADATEAYTHRIPAKSNVVEVLRALSARGHSLNVLTASPHPMLDPCLARLGIYDLFDNVWSCEDFGTGKSDPEIYRVAAARMGVPVTEVIFLDDNYNADKTAREAGCRVIGVFDESSREYEQDIRTITEAYIHDFSELL